MGVIAQARKLLPWTTKVQPVLADGATKDGPLVWIRSDDGTLNPCRAREAREFKFLVGGVPHEHVGTAPDGVWIYAARPY